MLPFQFTEKQKKDAQRVVLNGRRLTIKLDDNYYCKVFLIPNDSKRAVEPTQDFLREKFVLELINENDDSGLYQQIVSSGNDFLEDFGIGFEDTYVGIVPLMKTLVTGFGPRFLQNELKELNFDLLALKAAYYNSNGKGVKMGYIVTKTVPGITLGTWLAQQAGQVSIAAIQQIAFQLSWLVCKLHCDFGIVHHDLHEDNVFVEVVSIPEENQYTIGNDTFSLSFKKDDVRLRLIDFGSGSVKWDNTNDTKKAEVWRQSSRVVLWSHAPPELYLQANYNRSYPADTCSIGFILMNIYAHNRLKSLDGSVSFTFKNILESNFHMFNCSTELLKEKLLFDEYDDFMRFDMLRIKEITDQTNTDSIIQVVYSRLIQFYSVLYNGKPDFDYVGPVSKFVIESFSKLEINVDFKDLVGQMPFVLKSFVQKLLAFKEEKRLEFGLPGQKFMLTGSLYHPLFYDLQSNTKGLIISSINNFRPPLKYANNDTVKQNIVKQIIAKDKTYKDTYAAKFVISETSENLVNKDEITLTTLSKTNLVVKPAPVPAPSPGLLPLPPQQSPPPPPNLKPIVTKTPVLDSLKKLEQYFGGLKISKKTGFVPYETIDKSDFYKDADEVLGWVRYYGKQNNKIVELEKKNFVVDENTPATIGFNKNKFNIKVDKNETPSAINIGYELVYLAYALYYALLTDNTSLQTIIDKFNTDVPDGLSVQKLKEAFVKIEKDVATLVGGGGGDGSFVKNTKLSPRLDPNPKLPEKQPEEKKTDIKTPLVKTVLADESLREFVDLYETAIEKLESGEEIDDDEEIAFHLERGLITKEDLVLKYKANLQKLRTLQTSGLKTELKNTFAKLLTLLFENTKASVFKQKFAKEKLIEIQKCLENLAFYQCVIGDVSIISSLTLSDTGLVYYADIEDKTRLFPLYLSTTGKNITALQQFYLYGTLNQEYLPLGANGEPNNGSYHTIIPYLLCVCAVIDEKKKAKIQNTLNTLPSEYKPGQKGYNTTAAKSINFTDLIN